MSIFDWRVCLKTGDNIAYNIIGIFGSRVIAGYNYRIGELLGDPGHTRAFGPVPVSAAAKNDRQFSFAERFQHSQDVF